ncbi:SIR2 family protein [Mesorhizobium sp. M0563]|uniref:SIR2 family protein n=1 Tax=Mesorhizobium sp. M0563 TaxID=2956959 RepID=UPI00333D3E97
MSVELENVVDSFSRAAFHGNAAWFVGAGTSRASNLSGWVDLLKPLGKELGVTVTADDDLPAIAQYSINKTSGNRGPIIQHLRQSLGGAARPNIYHHQIARSNVGTIWTTNYDQLVETALAQASLRYRVRVRESDMVELAEPGTTDVIKPHGSFGVSDPAEFVIASEDFEDYAYRRPATVARLQSNLLSKSFLFVGYGYGDPNIRTVLLEARRLSQRSSHMHFMLTAAHDAADLEKAGRQELWKADLARIGIKCVLLPDYAAIEQAVERIARRSRGPTVYVTGSHTSSNPLASDVGKLLADPRQSRTILLDGQSAGISRDLLSAFQTACVDQQVDLNERLRFFPNPYSSNPKFSSDPRLLPLLKEWRSSLLRKAHSVLAFDGGMGTKAEVELAKELGCCIIPIPLSNTGSALSLLGDPQIADDLEKRAPGYVAKAMALNLNEADVVKCLLSDMPPWPH